MKIAIVYDWFDSTGGAERVLTTLHEMYPGAHWYTSYRDERATPWADGWDIQTSFMQRLPRFVRQNRVLSLLLFPLAFESFNFSQYDTVISVSSSFAKGIITRPQTRHIGYILTPTRWLWDREHYELQMQSVPRILRPLASWMRSKLLRWDYIAAQRPDEIRVISEEVQKRCLKYYERESEVIYPPFESSYWRDLVQAPGEMNTTVTDISQTAQAGGKYYLVLCRLESYKRVDIAIRAIQDWNKSDKEKRKLVIVGKGGQKKKLIQIAGQDEHIIFLDSLTDFDIAQLYTHAHAHLMPQYEDFGYTALEAMACDCPTVAYARGGALETVVDGETGVFFPQQTSESLRSALDRLESIRYNMKIYESSRIRRWSRDTFMAAFSQKVSKTI